MISLATTSLLALTMAPQVGPPAGAAAGEPAAPLPGAVGSLPQGHIHEVLHLIRVEGDGRALLRLQRLDLDILKQNLASGTVQVIASDEDVEAIEALGLTVVTEIEDLAAHYARRLAAPATGQANRAAGTPYGQSLVPAFGQGSMGGYYTFPEIVSVVDQLQASYPNLVSPKVSIGQTVQGRDIWMFKVSDNVAVDENEPEMRIDAMHHAREPQGMQTTIYFVSYLLEAYGTDPIATYLVNEREIYVLPCVNPDGYEFNRSQAPGGGGLWRKNRRNNGGGSVGVDLNRNYPFQWAVAGSSSNPDSDIYHGPSPGSEPETTAMMQFFGTRDFRTALSVHTFSDLWLSPWGYVPQFPPDWPEMQEIGDLAVTETGYPHGPAAIVLYEAAGTTLDYDYGQNGTYAWTPEIGSDSDGFWPAQNRIIPLAEDNRMAFARTALAAGPWLRPLDLTAVDAGNGDGVFDGGESVSFIARVRNSGRADAGTASMTLASSSAAATVTASTATASANSFATGMNTSPLELMIAAGTPAGTVIPVTVTVTEGGRSFDLDGTVVVGERIVASYDFEAGGAEGWSVAAPNDASTGNWERGDPVGTQAQPENDNTEAPGTRCWFTGQGSQGGSLGANDVDGGRTTLLSPNFDLDGAVSATLRFAHWYSNDAGGNSGADIFEVDVSANGGTSWTNAATFGPSGAQTTGGWQESEIDLGALGALTSDVRVRFIASDLGGGSIVEAAIDDVSVVAIDPPTCPAPVNYCALSPNGAGIGSFISVAGSQDVMDMDLTLSAVQVPPSSFGLFFYGSERDDFPIGNGRICVGGVPLRLPIVQADAAGAVAFPIDFTALPGPIVNGDTTHFQFWHRDTFGAGYNFSNAIEVTFCAAP